MKITVISGSHRKVSQSEKVARFAEARLQEKGLETDLFSLSGNPLPLWDEGIWAGEERWKTLLDPLSARLKASDAFVIVAPEWHGQIPSGLRNFMLLWSGGELAHKPALIIAVSSSIGGTYPVAELRMNSYKNNRICYMPEHLIVRNVESVFNDGPAETDADLLYRERLDWNLELLRAYAGAFVRIREDAPVFNKQFPFGM
ncbi:MAG: NAD(P)H-dependent oxidoreductase [Thiothrix sp.]|nr:NAD(P)H-dependent oxidoreductase [Thiothrix sp.]HPQ94207.1 NAD(P)H-dependent oxidoreductase [Thiolinea sp.]